MADEVSIVSGLLEYVPPVVEVLSGLFIILGGSWGLQLAERRLHIFSRQTYNAQAQLFNDRLGRGVELLANDSVTLRVAGVRILDDLAKTASQEESLLIVQLLYDFLRTKAKLKFKTEYESKEKIHLSEIKELGDRVDIALSIEAVLRLGSYCCSFSLAGLDLRGLDLSKIDFENADLRNSDLSYARSGPLTLNNADFSGANLENVYVGSSVEQSETESDIMANIGHAASHPFDEIIYEEDNPPINIPKEVTLPEHGAYRYDDIGLRRFVSSKEPVD